MKKRIENTGNVAVRANEGLRHVIDQPRRRIVADEIHRDLLCGVPRRRRMTAENIQCFLDFREASTLDDPAQESLVSEIVTGRIELEQAVADEQALQFRFEFRIFRLEIDGDT